MPLVAGLIFEHFSQKTNFWYVVQLEEPDQMDYSNSAFAHIFLEKNEVSFLPRIVVILNKS